MIDLHEIRVAYADPTPGHGIGPATFAAGRRCQRHGCTAFLSIYNPDVECFHHPMRTGPLDERAPLIARPAVRELAAMC